MIKIYSKKIKIFFFILFLGTLFYFDYKVFVFSEEFGENFFQHLAKEWWILEKWYYPILYYSSYFLKIIFYLFFTFLSCKVCFEFFFKNKNLRYIKTLIISLVIMFFINVHILNFILAFVFYLLVILLFGFILFLLSKDFL